MRERSRRQVLGMLGIGGIGGLAGCLGLEGGDADETETTTTTPSAEETAGTASTVEEENPYLDSTTEEESAAETGEESTGQVVNTATIVDVRGNVTGNSAVDMVNLSVMRAAGSENINLTRSTIQWMGPNEATSLTYSGTGIPSDDTDSYGFTTTEIRNAPDNMVLREDDSRIKITINADAFTEPLGEGDQVQVTLTTMYGTQVQYVVTVPESLDGKKEVPL